MPVQRNDRVRRSQAAAQAADQGPAHVRPRPRTTGSIIPTTSLYIEALVGTHPLLEDFKLLHRAIDVKKVQAEVRHAELENVRLAACAAKGKDEDPDIEKKIIIEGGQPAVAVTPDV